METTLYSFSLLFGTVAFCCRLFPHYGRQCADFIFMRHFKRCNLRLCILFATIFMLLAAQVEIVRANAAPENTTKEDSIGAVPLEDSAKVEYKRQAQMLLPELLYAVPGVELNIYFANVFLCINPANYFFDVDCDKGKNERKRWSFTPTEKDVGQFPLTLRVYDDDGIVAQGESTIMVAPRNTGAGENLSILLVGDSLTDQTHYVARLHTLVNSNDNPLVTMIGNHAGGGKKPLPGGVAHEGYGGFTWASFLLSYEISTSGSLPYRKSYFLKSRGKLDIPGYLDRFNDGKAPDYITFQLGVNDIFLKNDNDIEAALVSIGKCMDSLINAFREAAPDAIIGIGLSTLGASQDAFANNYQCTRTSWQFKKNTFNLNRFYIDKVKNSKDPKLVIIPTVSNLDCENNFPVHEVAINAGNAKQTTRQSNGVHPAVEGYKQIGDTYYAWLKWQLNRIE